MKQSVNLSNKICVLIDPETRHIDYIPINEIKVSKDLTIEDLFTEFKNLSDKFDEYRKTTNNSISSLIEVIKTMETQIDVLKNNQTRLGECYNSLHNAFKKQTSYSSANMLNLEYAVKLLGGKL
jgi:prophage DNA circulation protein